MSDCTMEEFLAKWFPPKQGATLDGKKWMLTRWALNREPNQDGLDRVQCVVDDVAAGRDISPLAYVTLRYG